MARENRTPLNPPSSPRHSLLFWPTSLYYVAIVADFTVRCLWVATLQSAWCYAGCSTIFAFAEIARRFMWVIFRVEHQALKVRCALVHQCFFVLAFQHQRSCLPLPRTAQRLRCG